MPSIQYGEHKQLNGWGSGKISLNSGKSENTKRKINRFAFPPLMCLYPTKKHIYLITVLWKKATRRLCPMFTREVLNNTESAEYEKYTEINNAFLQILDSSLVQMNRALLTDTIENILYREKHF
ncbi:MAG: hypothetical protein RI983_1047 [Bacteroidota bacterium]|jgi:hypothetical protein